ncbi:hypothetical protein FKO59_26860 [Burkholderia pseudomallei]|nr:hypothetical protein FKO42_26880 [Burkholderia pseudomallei]QDH42936.1 hypothetical protein FKO59_26860 [Burkholderia pseudomallei]
MFSYCIDVPPEPGFAASRHIEMMRNRRISPCFQSKTARTTKIGSFESGCFLTHRLPSINSRPSAARSRRYCPAC